MHGFRMPTRVHVEPGCLARLPEAVRSLGLQSVLLAVDSGLESTPWPDTARSLLNEAGIRTQTFHEIEPNPRTTTVTKIAEQIRNGELQGVVALGGGSVLDAAKAAAMLAPNEQRIEQYEGKNRYLVRPLPTVAVPTTCGTGSEVTWVAVLTQPTTRAKLSVKGETMFPAQALVDAELIATLPRDLVVTTAFDALTHALEATTSLAANPVSDALAEKAMALILRFLARAAADTAGDAAAREAVMRASTLAGLAFGNADVAAVHCLSESIGGIFDTPHGLTNAVLLLPVMRYHRPVIEERLAELDSLLFSTPESTPDSERAEHFLDAVAELARQLGIPPWSALGVPADAYQQIAQSAVRNGSNGSNPQPMSTGSYLEILQSL